LYATARIALIAPVDEQLNNATAYLNKKIAD
jgi:hypothetical protein